MQLSLLKYLRHTTVFVKTHQSGVAVTRPHGNHQDMSLNPATARNEKSDIGGPPAQKVAQGSGQDLSRRPAM